MELLRTHSLTFFLVLFLILPIKLEIEGNMTNKEFIDEYGYRELCSLMEDIHIRLTLLKVNKKICKFIEIVI